MAPSLKSNAAPDIELTTYVSISVKRKAQKKVQKKRIFFHLPILANRKE
jgi:hypothetical protein